MNRAQRRKLSHSHADTHDIAASAYKVLEGEIKKLNAEMEEIRQDYERQLHDKADDNWLRCIACAGIVFREISGSASKTDKYELRLAEYMKQTIDKTTAEILAEHYRATGNELEVQG